MKQLLVFLLLIYAVFASDKFIVINENIKLIPVVDSVYIHETLFDFPGYGPFPSNGLLFIKNGKALLVDTPASNNMTKTLVEYLRDTMSVEVTKAIVCHSHIDCMGGLPYLQECHISSVTHEKTIAICKKDSLSIPDSSFVDSLQFSFEGETILCHYFGAGHTIDNITVAFPKRKTLFGGCMVKSIYSQSLGNTKEADVATWDKTVAKVLNRFPEIEFVIPGHGAAGGVELLEHTIALVKKHRRQ